MRIYQVINTVALLALMLSTGLAHAASEFVFVAKILSNDDHGIIVRSSGNAYQIEKGVGCLSFWHYEGKRVLVVSPGLFLGVGSKIVLPDDNQECRIWDSKELGQWKSAATCTDGHWVQSVTGDGQLLVLEDRSVWEIDPVDAIITMLWLPTQNVLVCDNKIINSDDGEAVRANRLK
jgi:hypothetical protein